MKNKIDLKQVLQDALEGKATAKEIQKALATAKGQHVLVRKDEPGLYSVEGQEGLTEAQMLEVVGERPMLMLTIRRSPIPVRTSEEEAEKYLDFPAYPITVG